jgi:hypothetical protein
MYQSCWLPIPSLLAVCYKSYNIISLRLSANQASREFFQGFNSYLLTLPIGSEKKTPRGKRKSMILVQGLLAGLPIK